MNEFQQFGYGQPEIAPQSLLGGLIGAPAGGAVGRGVGDIFGNPNLGSRIGQFAGGLIGSLSPFGADPTAAYGQQQDPQQAQQLQQLQQLQRLQQLQQLQQQGQADQFAPQGLGSWVRKLAKPAGAVLGQVTRNPSLGGIVGGGLQTIGGFLPQSVDAQGGMQQQQHPLVQQLQKLQAQQQQLQQALQQVQQQAVALQRQLSAQAQAQVQGGGQIAPQSWLSDLTGLAGQLAQPVGGLIGGAFGNQQLGSQIGGIAGQLTGQLGRMLPQSVDPYAAYAQQAQQAGGQIAPQSWLTDLTGLAGQIAQPLGGFIGGQLGNQQLGSQIGGIAGQLTGQLGRMLPQSVDPYAAYAQQAQQAQLAQMAQMGGQQTMH